MILVSQVFVKKKMMKTKAKKICTSQHVLIMPPPPPMRTVPPLRLVQVGHRVGDVRLLARPERQVSGLVAPRDADALKDVLQRHEADLLGCLLVVVFRGGVCVRLRA